MLMINLFALTFLLLKAIRSFLLTFTPSNYNSDWFVVASSQRLFNSPFCSKALYFYLRRINQGLTFSLGFHLAIQVILGWLPLILVVFALFTAILLLLACIDWFYLLLPNSIVLILLALGLMTSTYLFGFNLIDLLVRSAGCYGIFWLTQTIYYLLRHRVGLGQGDIKLLTALASWYDIHQLCIVVLSASLAALPFCIYQHRYLNSLHAIIVPYGTFLSLSGICCSYIFHQNIFSSTFGN